MEGTVVNFTGAYKSMEAKNKVVVLVGASAEKTIGKKVVWTSPAKKEIAGKIMQLHGRKGAVYVLFEKGLPGQAVGTKVKIE